MVVIWFGLAFPCELGWEGRETVSMRCSQLCVSGPVLSISDESVVWVKREV